VSTKKKSSRALELALRQANEEVLRSSKILIDAEEAVRRLEHDLKSARENERMAQINHRLAVQDVRNVERLK
jgi:hypothetical protein